ncbi:3-keto-5-aminohexanoate cleavage protein [Amycolatopsis sp. Poz14]|uniref:3-keto-5-aminohexanoate cleavage protein n=1 Tax=Amycolatopsis sp. Poz14 TaxID=1447705 RepID=UPI001EE8DBE5|nr:3-keto-5-aminohexanoate cleavage protein [Amycolatopsis sp. Poz14]MCG3754011.1 3-keto-5-aminohexanoate cleavage protein [Amycolatopsis sp. Poz14]
MAQTPLIINAAISGSLSKNVMPNLPKDAEDIGRMAVEVAQAGASIVHIHAKDDDGEHTGEVEYFRRAMDYVRDAGCDVVINLTTSFSASSTDDWETRFGPVTLSPELASYDAGTMNFGDHVFSNTPAFLRDLAKKMQEYQVKPEIEVFDTAQIGNAVRIAEEGLIDDPLYMQFVLGVHGGAPATAKQLVHLVESIPPGTIWSVAGIGRHQLPMDALAILMGGHARTGLEDNWYYEKGRLATNRQLVERLAGLAKTFGREVATPAQAREILGIG